MALFRLQVRNSFNVNNNICRVLTVHAPTEVHATTTLAGELSLRIPWSSKTKVVSSLRPASQLGKHMYRQAESE